MIDQITIEDNPIFQKPINFNIMNKRYELKKLSDLHFSFFIYVKNDESTMQFIISIIQRKIMVPYYQNTAVPTEH